MILTANGPLLTGTGPLYAPYAAPPAAVARTPNPISDSQIHSGHSLTDGGVAGGNGFPNQHYGQFIDTIDGSTPDVTIETVPGSSMTFRRENVSSDAWVNMANYQAPATAALTTRHAWQTASSTPVWRCWRRNWMGHSTD
ncbi:MAG: hypothetical protein AAGC96_18185, partial [Pseudomonadota bacterium]